MLSIMQTFGWGLRLAVTFDYLRKWSIHGSVNHRLHAYKLSKMGIYDAPASALILQGNIRYWIQFYGIHYRFWSIWYYNDPGDAHFIPFFNIICFYGSRLREERLQRIDRYRQRLSLLLPSPPAEQGRTDDAATSSWSIATLPTFSQISDPIQIWTHMLAG